MREFLTCSMRTRAFLTLALHAKMHERLTGLDAVVARRREDVARIERAEIIAFADDAQWRRLEALKAELLRIRFEQEG